MGDMSTSIARSDEQQVGYHHEQSHIFQSDSPNKHEVYPIFRFTDGCSHHNGQNRGRSPQQIRTMDIRTEVRKHIIRQHIKQSATQTTQQIESTEMSGREKGQEQLSEPIKPQHIEQQMQRTSMQEHVSQQRPRLHQELRQRGRQFQIRQPGSDIPIEKHQKYAYQSSHNKYAHINID